MKKKLLGSAFWLIPAGLLGLAAAANLRVAPEALLEPVPALVGKTGQNSGTAPAPSSGASSRKIELAILLGVKDSDPASWDGSIRLEGGRILELRGRRPAEGDRLGAGDWTLSSRRTSLTRSRQDQGAPVLETGFYVQAELQDPEARFEVTTVQGNFAFSAAEADWGRTLTFLDGRVRVERTPASLQLTDSPEEQDFPALAVSGDTIYLAYVEFRHGDRSQAWPWQLQDKPQSYQPLSRPAGGDQVFLREYSSAGHSWGPPQAVSEAGQDLYQAAVAVDGTGRVWVIWSAQVDGNFDLYARYRDSGRWSDTRRLTRHPGTDLWPVAATDSEGSIWVVWQGYREDNLEILGARQQADSFSAEQRISFSPASDWTPHLAAGPDGEMAVVWDTYDKGDYDVYLRRLHYRNGMRLQEPVPVAASAGFEARPSAVYDPAGRLWIAYEESYPGWGKDFGAYETTGSGLYQGNTVRVKVLEGSRFYQTAGELKTVVDRLPGVHPVNQEQYGRRAPAPHGDQPDPSLAENRRKGLTPYHFAPPLTSHARLAAAPDGRIYLAYRNADGRVWGPLGTAWFENIVYYDSAGWQGPVFSGRSEGVLGVRPALAPLGDSGILMVVPTDHRFTKSGIPHGESAEPFNYDLMAYEMLVAQPAGRPELIAVADPQPSAPDSQVAAEKAQVTHLRDYRVQLDSAGGAETLRLLRGEFHRHTAISTDGGIDGDIEDAWRYLIDAAYMDWAGCCDHDNGGGREYTWWLTQKMTDAFLLQGRFIPMFSYERSVAYPEGHRNVIFAERGIRPLPRLPKTDPDSPSDPAPDTQMLYEYLRHFDGVAAVHTSATNMGTDWRDNDPEVEPMVEIYQGDRQNYEMPGAPRTNMDNDSIGGWRPLGFVSLALDKGYRLAFQASSDHISTHMSYCNVWVTGMSREEILEGFKKRRIYGATDNILADVRCGEHFMGEEFTLDRPPSLKIKLDGTAPFSAVHIIKDGRFVYVTRPDTANVELTWVDTGAQKGTTSYYYVRGEQSDGEIVWVSPMWITLR